MMSGSRNDLDNPPVAMAELRAVAGWRQLVRARIMPAERSSSSELLTSGSHSDYVYGSDAVAPRWDSSATPGTSGETILQWGFRRGHLFRVAADAADATRSRRPLLGLSG